MSSSGSRGLAQRLQQPQAHAQTTTTTSITPQTDTQIGQPQTQAVLRLRGANAPGPSVRWADDVVDNEGLGRKSSKGIPPGLTLRLQTPMQCSRRLLYHDANRRGSMLHLPPAQGRGRV
jgi:hypothetical protein